MPVISDSLSDAQRAQLGVIAEPPPEPLSPVEKRPDSCNSRLPKSPAEKPTRREREAKRDALVEVSGHLNFKGQRCLPCPRCSRVFLASSLRRLRTPGADASLVCRKCADQAIAALGYHDHDH